MNSSGHQSKSVTLDARCLNNMRPISKQTSFPPKPSRLWPPASHLWRAAFLADRTGKSVFKMQSTF
jgi:hypothetical protein